jgi:hypothetical protein
LAFTILPLPLLLLLLMLPPLQQLLPPLLLLLMQLLPLLFLPMITFVLTVSVMETTAGLQ